MTRRTNHGRVRCAIGAVFALGLAVVVPAPAWADDGQAVSLPAGTPAGVAAAVEAAVGGGDVAGAVEHVVSAALDEAAPTATVVTEPADQADESQSTSDPATPTVTQETAPKAADTTVQAPDTTSDTPASTPKQTVPTAVPAAVAVQVSPTNVNVSVRVASPGDNGPVTQINVAAATAVTAPASSAGTVSHEAAERPAAIESGSKESAVSPRESPAVSPSDSSGGTWDWQWDCLSVPAFSMMSPAGSNGGITPNNWIWNWNCGTNTSQYQDGSAGQYHPVNVNVGIRLSSPGNDGPVTQANVVVAIAAGGDTGAAPPPGVPSDPPPVWAPAAEQQPSFAPPEASAGLAGEVATGAVMVEAVVLPPADEDIDPGHGTSRPGGGLGPWVGLAASGGGPFAPFPGGVGWDTGVTALAPVVIRPLSLSGTVRSADRGQTRPTSKQASASKPAPRWSHPAPIQRSTTGQSSGTSVAPAGAGGSSSGGLPLVLALPFLAAVLDMARRLALDRVATPSGHRSRVPDDPG